MRETAYLQYIICPNLVMGKLILLIRNSAENCSFPKNIHNKKSGETTIF